MSEELALVPSHGKSSGDSSRDCPPNRMDLARELSGIIGQNGDLAKKFAEFLSVEQLRTLIHTTCECGSPSGRGVAGVTGAGESELEYTEGLPGAEEQIGRLESDIGMLREENACIRARNAQLQKQLQTLAGPRMVEKLRVEEEAADRLSRERKVAFRRMPDGVYPGMPYVTQQELLEEGTVIFSRGSLSRLLHDQPDIPSVSIADRTVIPPSGVAEILARQDEARSRPNVRQRPGVPRDTRSRKVRTQP